MKHIIYWLLFLVSALLACAPETRSDIRIMAAISSIVGLGALMLSVEKGGRA